MLHSLKKNCSPEDINWVPVVILDTLMWPYN